MADTATHVGAGRRRVDGPAKVTGAARYAAEYTAPDLLHGAVVSGTIARGRIRAIDASRALAVPGVVAVLTHETRPRTAWLNRSHRDEVAPPGAPFRALYDDRIHFSGQPVALVLAEEWEIARHAATLVAVEYAAEAPTTDLELARVDAYVPPKKRGGIAPPPADRGDAPAAFDRAAIRVRNEYRVPVEHHNPMETHAATVVHAADGSLTIHDKTQGPQNSQAYVCGVFGLAAEQVRVVSPYVGGAFGSGLRPQYQLYLAVMAALELQRSVRVTLTRAQMFTMGYRPETIQTVSLGADAEGRLESLAHEAIANTSGFEDYQENVVNWSGLLYRCDNVHFDYRLAKLDRSTPSDMRAPGAAIGLFALETAMDELAHLGGIDPLQLRLRNYADQDRNAGKPFTSKELRACYAQGAERFGWSRRNPAPRSMREGRELIGWGMASGVWEALVMPTSARAVLRADGRLEVASATADIGTGTYTILTQIAADALGLPMAEVTALVGDSSLPKSPVEGGSWAAASAGSAVLAACETLRARLLELARGLDDSPLANAGAEQVAFVDGRIRLIADPGRSLGYAQLLRAAGRDEVAAEAQAGPDKDVQKRFSANAHSAVFAEARVDEQLGVARVTRIVSAVAAGRILNPRTARSQILGGVVMGIGMALHEETLTDHRLGRFMNRNLGEYHVPAHADVHDIEVIFVAEQDDKLNPLGVKGVGEIGIVGTAAAIGNAIFHATGRRVRDLPITIDKILNGAA